MELHFYDRTVLLSNISWISLIKILFFLGGRVDTCIYMAGSLYCPLEAVITLPIHYTPIPIWIKVFNKWAWRGFPRWWRNRMGRPLSPKKIHQKINCMCRNFHKTTSEHRQKTPDTQKDKPISSKWGRTEDKDAKKRLRIYGWRSILGRESWKINFHTIETLSQAGSVGRFGISDGSITKKNRNKITTEFSINGHCQLKSDCPCGAPASLNGLSPGKYMPPWALVQSPCGTSTVSDPHTSQQCLLAVSLPFYSSTEKLSLNK